MVSLPSAWCTGPVSNRGSECVKEHVFFLQGKEEKERGEKRWKRHSKNRSSVKSFNNKSLLRDLRKEVNSSMWPCLLHRSLG